jgi:REP element-mobilizing transposase RayT
MGIRSQKRFGLSVLDYMVTCNHVHLLIKDTGPNVIACSMQLIAGRTGQEYYERKGGTARFGRTAIMPPLLKPTSTCIIVSCKLS